LVDSGHDDDGGGQLPPDGRQAACCVSVCVVVGFRLSDPSFFLASTAAACDSQSSTKIG
jgi:hypothetical protein